MEINVGNDLNRHLRNEKMEMTKYSEAGIVVITIPEKLTNNREYAIGGVLLLLKRNNQHLKITAIGFTPPQNGYFECFLNLEEKSYV